MRLEPFVRREYKAQLVRQYVSRQAAVLDLGCGLDHYRSSQASPWISVDLAHHPDIRADCAHLPLRSQLFDAILLFDVIEHVRQLPVLFAELTRVLRPRGTVVLITPNTLGFGLWDSFADPSHVHHFARATLRRWAERSGFTVTAWHTGDLHLYLKRVAGLPRPLHLALQQSLICELRRQPASIS